MENYGGPERRGCPALGCREPKEAAKRAVHEVFSILGVDVDNPEQVEKFREGLRFGQSMLKFANRGLMTFIIVSAASATAALWLGIKAKIVGGP